MTCSVEDCTYPVDARGWCVRHYRRWWRHGDPTAGGPLQPTQQIRLDAGPLLQAIRARAVDGIRPLLGSTAARTYYRSRDRGWVTEPWADRICCRVLGEPLTSLYGTDYDQEAA